MSQSASLLASLVGLGFGCAAAVRSEWTLLIPAGIATLVSVLTWFTRVRTTVTDEGVTFAQLGKRIQVRFDEVVSCEAARDPRSPTSPTRPGGPSGPSP